jgi:ATP dependent DNA ligase C terminal region
LRRSQISIGRNEPGRRSGAWVKVKLTQQQQEFVIGGYTPPEGSRKYFGALLVGYYGPEGLLFAGRVGTGFSERALEALYDGYQKMRRTMAMLALAQLLPSDSSYSSFSKGLQERSTLLDQALKRRTLPISLPSKCRQNPSRCRKV